MNKKEVRPCLEDLTSTTTPEASGFVVSPDWFGCSLGFLTRTQNKKYPLVIVQAEVPNSRQ